MGSLANTTYPVDFLSDNLLIQTNVMDAALAQRVERLLFLGSSCIYPRLAPQPIKEDYLLTGTLEQTNDAYAIAKIAGIIGVQAVRRQYGLPWISAMPTNLYGPGRQLLRQRLARAAGADPPLRRRGPKRRARGHELGYRDAAPRVPARRRHGRGVPAPDGATTTVLPRSTSAPGRTSRSASSRRRSLMLSAITGTTTWDASKPDGTPQKLMDVSTINAAGWTARISLRDGISSTIDWYRSHSGQVRT